MVNNSDSRRLKVPEIDLSKPSVVVLDPLSDKGIMILELEEYLNNQISIIEKDDRFHYKKADIQINAPLALIQVDLVARHRALTDVLNYVESN
mgnify:CR=1 FL=1